MIVDRLSNGSSSRSNQNGMAIDSNPNYVDRFKLILVAFVANLGSMLFGLDFGLTSFLLIDIDNFADSSSNSANIYYTITADSSALTGLIAAGASIGATITYLFLLFFGNSISKKDEILLAALLFFVGGLLESFSGYVSWRDPGGLVTLIFGRLIYGAGVATSFHSVPQYISEIAPADLRGTIGSATEAMVVAGVVLGYLLGNISSPSDGWTILFVISYVIALVMGCLALMMPHSPTWLTRFHHPTQEILEALRFIYPYANETSVEHLRKVCDHEKMERLRMEAHWRATFYHKSGHVDEDRDESIWVRLPPEIRLLLFDAVLRRCLLFAIILVIFQMGTGQNAILYFAGDIFGSICPDSTNDCILGLGIAKLIPAVSMTVVADSFRRRHILLFGTGIMIVGLVILCFGLEYDSTLASLMGIYSAVVGYELGFGSMLWILLQEIFPAFVRSAANSIAVATLFAFATIITFTLPYFEETAGISGVFIFFTIMSSFAIILLYLLAPETRGVDLEVAYKLVDKRFRRACEMMGIIWEDSDDESGLVLEEEMLSDSTRLLI